ncbi:hypothetical protein COCVIDRAFT_17232 [Bipolaris victoriae FI3]|uniref:Autophagy-related protein n=1 Tax=Bipolaris victoriae (strain FI3) TaxID=930091 RepID=W7EFG7_BIPV3|nr:hypothetical protein COCVIDRAFT_17232 [Bipolaris victoriae FI3]
MVLQQPDGYPPSPLEINPLDKPHLDCDWPLGKKSAAGVVEISSRETLETLNQLDDKYRMTNKELWAYHCYYIGDNGLTMFNCAPTAFQNLVLWDMKPNILISLSTVDFGIEFGRLEIHTKEDWQIGIYRWVNRIPNEYYFWTAAFPGLVRNTDVRNKAKQLAGGTITREEYEFVDMMKMNKSFKPAFHIQFIVQIIIFAIILSIIFSLCVDSSAENNNWGLSVIVAFVTRVWVLCAIPWVVLDERRLDQDLESKCCIGSCAKG